MTPDAINATGTGPTDTLPTPETLAIRDVAARLEELAHQAWTSALRLRRLIGGPTYSSYYRTCPRCHQHEEVPRVWCRECAGVGDHEREGA